MIIPPTGGRIQVVIPDGLGPLVPGNYAFQIPWAVDATWLFEIVHSDHTDIAPHPFDLSGCAFIFSWKLNDDDILPTLAREATVTDAVNGLCQFDTGQSDRFIFIPEQYACDGVFYDSAGKRSEGVLPSRTRVTKTIESPGDPVTVPASSEPLALGPKGDTGDTGPAGPPGATDHHALTNLTTFDDHSQYAHLAGRAGGQIFNGGVAAAETLTLSATSHATPGQVIISAGASTPIAKIGTNVDGFSSYGMSFTNQATANGVAFIVDDQTDISQLGVTMTFNGGNGTPSNGTLPGTQGGGAGIAAGFGGAGTATLAAGDGGNIAENGGDAGAANGGPGGNGGSWYAFPGIGTGSGSNGSVNIGTIFGGSEASAVNIASPNTITNVLGKMQMSDYIFGGGVGASLTLLGSTEADSAALVLQSATAGGNAVFNSDVSWTYKGSGGGRFFSPLYPPSTDLPGDSLSFFGGNGTGSQPGGALSLNGGPGDESSGTGDGGAVTIAGGTHAIGGGSDGTVQIYGSAVILRPSVDGGSVVQIRNANGDVTPFYVNTDSVGNAQAVVVAGSLTKFETGGPVQFDDPRVSINGVQYNFTNTQGGAGTLATNDGFGNISWTMGGGSSVPAPYTCPSGAVVGDVVYISADDTVALASAASIATGPAFGMISSKLTSTTCTVTRTDDVGGFVGLIANQSYYLDRTNPGKIIASVTGYANPNFTQRVGTARNSTTLSVKIDLEIKL